MKNPLILGVLLSSVPLMTAAADEYYIAQEVSTKRCMIVESPPATTELVLVENGKIFFDRDEAQRVVASLPLCASRAAPASTSPRVSQDRARRTIASKGRATADQSRSRPIANAQPGRSRDPFSGSFFTLFR